MHGLIRGQVTSQSFVRSALVVAACVVAAALILLPIAMGQGGSGRPGGLAAAVAICLFSACLVEGISGRLSRTGSHLAAALLSMALRFAPPLAVCIGLAAAGQSGRQHLAFVSYLLTFYFVALAAETWLAVKRVGSQSTAPRRVSR